MSENAKRAGWIGCNIDISKVAESGKVFLVKNTKIIDYNLVKDSFNKMISKLRLEITLKIIYNMSFGYR